MAKIGNIWFVGVCSLCQFLSDMCNTGSGGAGRQHEPIFLIQSEKSLGGGFLYICIWLFIISLT